MNKTELIQALKNSNGLSRSEAEKIVSIFFNEMANALARGDRVEIRGFCSFFVKKYRSYTGRNPKKGFDTTALMKATVFNQRKIHNITFRLKRQGRIKSGERGVTIMNAKDQKQNEYIELAKKYFYDGYT